MIIWRNIVATSVIVASVAAVAHAGLSSTSDVTAPGNIAAIPWAPDTSYAPLTLSETRITSRQALDAAEAWSSSTDSDIDPNARATPAIVTVGQNPAIHAVNPAFDHIKAWVVTINRDPGSLGPLTTIANPTEYVRFVSHKLCIVIDALSGKFIVAYNAGHEDRLNSP